MARKVNLSIRELIAYDNWSSYKVGFGFDGVFVTVTQDPSIVCYWISKVTFLNYKTPPGQVVVGVRTEWKNNRSSHRLYHRVDILQLCVQNHCLIYHIHRANRNIPQQFHEFLGNNRFTFVGIGIHDVYVILRRDYEISFGERMRDLSAREHNDPYRFYRVREMSNLVIGLDYDRPDVIDLSDWDALSLEPDQVMYACADAVVCFMAGLKLEVWNFKVPPRN